MNTYISTPSNTAKLGVMHSNIQTAQRGPSLVGSEPTMHYSAHLWVSALAHYASQALWSSSFVCLFVCLQRFFYLKFYRNCRKTPRQHLSALEITINYLDILVKGHMRYNLKLKNQNYSPCKLLCSVPLFWTKHLCSRLITCYQLMYSIHNTKCFTQISEIKIHLTALAVKA